MKKNDCTTTELGCGAASVYDFGSAKLHAYKTNDLIDDEVFVVEKDGRGFVIEYPCFFSNIEELAGYIADAGIEIEGIVAQLKGYQAAGIDLVLTSHYTPEDLKDVQAKIDYLESLKAIAAQCADAAGFKAAVQERYPEYAGENYLDMTTSFFFGE